MLSRRCRHPDRYAFHMSRKKVLPTAVILYKIDGHEKYELRCLAERGHRFTLRIYVISFDCVAAKLHTTTLAWPQLQSTTNDGKLRGNCAVIIKLSTDSITRHERRMHCTLNSSRIHNKIYTHNMRTSRSNTLRFFVQSI